MVLLLFSAEKVVSRKKEIVSLYCYMKSLSTLAILLGTLLQCNPIQELLSSLESRSQQRDSDVNQVTYILSNY